MQEEVKLSKQSSISKEVSLIQIIPMTYDAINCSTIYEAQSVFFVNKLLEREDCRYYLNSGIKANRNTLLLFQLDRNIIACARLKEVIKLDNEYEGNSKALLLYPESIQVFEPIHKHVLMEISHKVKEPDHPKYKIEDKKQIQTILKLIEQNTSNFILSKKCLKKGFDIAETCSKNKSIRELISLSESNFTINRKYIIETTLYHRNPYLKQLIKKLAQGYCHLCEKLAPFSDYQGEPYLEVHHVIRLADGGLDELGNVVALCPNCHRRVHILNDKDDYIKLKNIAERIRESIMSK